MTVGADELAIGDLVQDCPPIVLADQVADVGRFRLPWKVIPLHRNRIEGLSAVGARFPFLQGQIPRKELCVKAPFLLEPARPDALVVTGIVGSPAFFTPRLVTFTPTMKFVQWLWLLT
jgi:hypothetical protein